MRWWVFELTCKVQFIIRTMKSNCWSSRTARFCRTCWLSSWVKQIRAARPFNARNTAGMSWKETTTKQPKTVEWCQHFANKSCRENANSNKNCDALRHLCRILQQKKQTKSISLPSWPPASCCQRCTWCSSSPPPACGRCWPWRCHSCPRCLLLRSRGSDEDLIHYTGQTN